MHGQIVTRGLPVIDPLLNTSAAPPSVATTADNGYIMCDIHTSPVQQQVVKARLSAVGGRQSSSSTSSVEYGFVLIIDTSGSLVVI